MANQNQVPGKIPALRTYAQDLEDTRHAKNLSPKVVAIDEPAATPKVSVHKVAPTAPKKITPTNITPKRENALIDVTKELNDIGTKIIIDNEDAASATVITDTKRDRFKLFPAILNSLNNWFSDQKKSHSRKAVPKYTIPETTRRKGLIQKATSHTGTIATADFSNLQERIKQRTDEVEEAEVVGHTIWTPDTEPGFLLLEETNSSPVTNVIIEPRKSYYNEVPLEDEDEDEADDLETDEAFSTWENEAEEESPPVEPETPQTVESVSRWEAVDIKPIEEIVVEAPQSEWVMPEVKEVSLPAQDLETTTQVISTPPVAIAQESSVIAEAGPATQLIPPKRKPSRFINQSFWSQLHHLNTNTLALLISAFVLIVVVGIVLIQLSLNQERVTPTKEVSTPESLLLNTNINLIVNSNDSASTLVANLNALKPTRREIIQAVFMEAFPENYPMRPVSVLNLLNLDVEKNLAQSITELRFGFTSEQQPFILMKVPSIIVAQGGLFLWEENLYPDFARLFTLDPIPQSSNLNFSDSTFAGRDVRLIKQPSGSELLIYGIINNTVIITTTSSSYRELSILIK
ncbi:MAG TPA: hypothetical protein PKA42_00555 [Candidatus Paceibacterota bacterium]|nr:hypothetical protein [Candidatus Paceibacterota bacterium]HMO82636.1 hypothetical protein [Candidatus Paceibacterota bacterium]